ncbi:EAL domain-containing protein [Pseudanabaena sp. ABRG5-3]|uniref:EAL domain-containing protein n=1 Tax=Pseudanabaena sp. ABRG5-3 TaxID=685565 RepID=UPI000DC729C8|nr:EAL domain-containing protein [Pseudanabaena sp. ABRG5-3]BBC22584.1 diguanylate_cyclase/phosphodiesterase [Pseudanabaena sp. ABRG5-3]
MKDILHHVLTVEDPKGFRNFLLQNMTYSLGRSLDNLIVLRSNLVSRQHATILAVNIPNKNSCLFRIIDGTLEGTRSTNGILINGKKRFSHILSHGDEILFSKDTKAVYQIISSLSPRSKNIASPNHSANEDSFGENKQSLDFIGTIRCSNLLSIADSDLSAHIRDTINQFVSSPELNPQPIIELNLVGKILYLNPAALYQFPEVDDMQLNHPLLQNLLAQLIPLVTPVRNFFTREVEINGKVFEEVIHFMPWNEVVRVHISDITKQKQAEAIISYQMYHDSLTGLPNRKYLHQYLVEFVEKLEDKNQKFAVLFLDIDRFKLINDSLGHVIGDLLLKAVGDRLKTLLRQGDLLVRWGGDEFAIIAKAIASPDIVVQIAETMIQSLTVPFTCSGHELHITTSIGASIYPDHNTDVEGLIRNADMAMYRAKVDGRNSFQFYIPNMQEQSFQRLLMENNLRRALENEELETYYQPQVDLTTGKIVGLEVLLRWKHVALGSIPPSKFIPLAEETGLIIAIGAWVLRHTCLQAIAWQSMGLPPIQIGVNLSIMQLQQKDFLPSLQQILDETNFDPHYLELEITEGIMMDNVEEKIVLLNQFRQMGIQLSIDDFGTGYSALSYLKNLPIDTLKIDRTFIEYIDHNEQDQAIVASLISLSHSLNLVVIAEGVETQEQMELLRSLGCDRIQGHFFYKALPAEDIESLLRAQAITKPS